MSKFVKQNFIKKYISFFITLQSIFDIFFLNFLPSSKMTKLYITI